MGLSVFVSISTMCEPALGLNWDLNCVSDTYRMPSLMMELAGSGLLSPLSLPIANSDKSISPVFFIVDGSIIQSLPRPRQDTYALVSETKEMKTAFAPAGNIKRSEERRVG